MGLPSNYNSQYTVRISKLKRFDNWININDD